MEVTQERFERFLSDITTCFLTQDFALWSSRVILPFTLVMARGGSVVLKDTVALERNFRLYVVASKVMRLDQVLRSPLELEDCGDGTWLGTYETRLVSQGGLTIAPYVSTAMLQDQAGRLKMTAVLNARGFQERG